MGSPKAASTRRSLEDTDELLRRALEDSLEEDDRAERIARLKEAEASAESSAAAQLPRGGTM